MDQISPDKVGLEIPKGPISPENQALLINVYNLKPLIEEKMEKHTSPFLKQSFETDLTRLDHAKRYATGQPFDPITASFGIDMIEKHVLKRSYDNKNPEDAAAACQELPLIDKTQKNIELYIREHSNF